MKFLVDHAKVQVVVTRGSALRIELGRDSLAGRVSTLDVGVLSLTEIVRFHNLAEMEPFLPDNGFEPLSRKEFWRDLVSHGQQSGEVVDRALTWFSERGG